MVSAASEPGDPWIFGNRPLEQTLALAPVLRRLVATAVSMEEDDMVVPRLLEDLAAVEADLASRAPADPSPRIGPDTRPDQRVYIDHGRDIGSYNPCFPEYEIHVEGEVASGTVSFPAAFEGPPGCVHGGFLAVFFDCVIQHHNCDYGVAGKTTSLHVEYRHPTPIFDTLRFAVERSSHGRRISSRAHIEQDGAILCRASMEAAAGDRFRLPDVSPRRRRP